LEEFNCVFIAIDLRISALLQYCLKMFRAVRICTPLVKGAFKTQNNAIFFSKNCFNSSLKLIHSAKVTPLSSSMLKSKSFFVKPINSQFTMARFAHNDHPKPDHHDDKHGGDHLYAPNSSKSRDLYQNHFYHYTSVALVTFIPAGIILYNTSLGDVIDVALSFFIPAHAHLGMNLVIDDYLPGGANQPSKIVLWIFTTLAFFGLVCLNFSGGGISASIMRFWKKPIDSIHSAK